MAAAADCWTRAGGWGAEAGAGDGALGRVTGRTPGRSFFQVRVPDPKRILQ